MKHPLKNIFFRNTWTANKPQSLYKIYVISASVFHFISFIVLYIAKFEQKPFVIMKTIFNMYVDYDC